MPADLAAWAVALPVYPSCDLQAAIEDAGRWYVACGRAGVWIVADKQVLAAEQAGRSTPASPDAIDSAPPRQFVLLRQVPSKGKAVAFQQSPDGLRVIVHRSVSVPLSNLTDPPAERSAPVRAPAAPAPAPAQPAATKPKKGEVVGRVVAVEPFRVVISDVMGNLHEGDVVAFGEGSHAVTGRVTVEDYRPNGFRNQSLSTDESAPDSEQTSSDAPPEEKLALVRIGQGEDVPPINGFVYSTDRDPSRQLMFPKPTPYRASISVLGRLGSANIQSFSFGSFSSRNVTTLALEVDGHINFNKLRLGGALQPLASFGGDRKTYEAFGYADYSLHIFSVGVEVGAARVLDNDLNTPGGGLLFGPRIRIGMEDGFHFIGQTALYVHRQRLMPGSMRGAFQVPLHERVAAVIVGSVSRSGYYLFEGGLRLILAGDGGRGTFIAGLRGGYSAIVPRNFDEALGGHFTMMLATRF